MTSLRAIVKHIVKAVIGAFWVIINELVFLLGFTQILQFGTFLCSDCFVCFIFCGVMRFCNVNPRNIVSLYYFFIFIIEIILLLKFIVGDFNQTFNVLKRL